MQGLIGICKKAGKLVTGTETVFNLLKKGKIYLIILSSDASLNTKKQVINKSLFYNCKFIEIDKDIIKNAFNTNKYKVIGILDNGFKEAFLAKL